MPMSEPPRVLLWARSNQAAFINQAVGAAGLKIIVAGSPESDSAADLARTFGVERCGDLRQGLRREDVDLAWFAAEEPLSADLRAIVAERGLAAASVEPQFGSLAEVGEQSPWTPAIDMAPRMTQSPGFRAAEEVMASFGSPECVNVAFRSGPGQGTLHARLFDAMATVAAVCGPIERLNAGLAGPLPSVPDDLSDLHGHLTANVRFKSNRCASLSLSDTAGIWFRGITVLGPGGCLRINDDGFEWIDPEGKTIDSQASPRHSAPGELAGRQMIRLLDQAAPAEPPLDVSHLLACCEAARLSCLTGQDESPQRLVEMLSRP